MNTTTFVDITLVYVAFFAFAVGIGIGFLLWLALGGKDK